MYNQGKKKKKEVGEKFPGKITRGKFSVFPLQ